MVSDWPMVPLGEVVLSVERPEVPAVGQMYRQIGVKLWGQGAYERESIDGSQTKYKTLSLVEADDIIVNKIWARHGSVAVVPNNLAGRYVSSEFPTFVPIREKLEPRWFHWITKTSVFWEQCAEKSHGTSGKNRIRPERFLEVKIPLPPLNEQHRIVARIEELAALIEEARGLRVKAREEAQTLTHTCARGLLAEVDAEITELRCWLDQDRNGIQTGPFGAQLGSHDFVDAGVPIITIGNVQHNGLVLEGLKYVTPEKADQLVRFTMREGDILFARMGTVGRSCVVPKEAEGWLFNYHIIRVALDKSKVDPRYIHWTMRTSEDIDKYLSEKIRGATRQGVNSEIVGSLPCRIPALPDQRRIVAYLDGLQAQVAELTAWQDATQVELEVLLPAVLDRAFRGEL
jgi:type I restriction enzyme S subunit